jgi:hypothetical protein
VIIYSAPVTWRWVQTKAKVYLPAASMLGVAEEPDKRSCANKASLNRAEEEKGNRTQREEDGFFD